MSSTSRPHATGTSNIQQGQSPAKSSQVDTNQVPNVAQPLYQNNPNPQFIPNNMPLINPAQQLQFQSQLSNIQQTAAFLQRQTQLIHQQQQQQQQQQPNSVESQMKNQPLGNGPLGSFHNFPELLNFFLLSNSNLNIPMPQLNPTQTPVQQPSPLQTPKTVPVSPSKSGPSQHTPRSATTGPRSIGANITNVQTAEINSATSTATTPSATNSEQNTEISKQLLTMSSPFRSSSASTVTTPSSTISDRFVEEVRERANALIQGAKNKLPHDDTILSNNITTPPKDIDHEIVSSPETNKSTLPRRKQTNVTSPIKANPIISPSTNPTVPHDSLTFSTPKKSVDVRSSTKSPSTPAAEIIPLISVPATPTTPQNKKQKSTKEIQKLSKKSGIEPKPPSATDVQKPATSSSKDGPSTSIPNESEIKSKRNRFKTNLYQSPTPELVLATRMSVNEANKNSVGSKDKLIIFFADEFIAVRNDEGSFYLCQCGHNMYRTSKKCRVRWLNKEDNSDTYKLTFYDHIDKECILTSVSLESVADNSYKLSDNERERIDNILKKSIDVEKGILPRPEVTEENPDGLDISLYRNESQIKTDNLAAGHKRKSESSTKISSLSPSKKIKHYTKTSSMEPPLNRRKNNNLFGVESPKAIKKTSKQSKKNMKRRISALKGNVPSSSTSDESDAGKKRVAKTKKQKKTSASSASSTVVPERTLRNRSKN